MKKDEEDDVLFTVKLTHESRCLKARPGDPDGMQFVEHANHDTITRCGELFARRRRSTLIVCAKPAAARSFTNFQRLSPLPE